MWRYLPMTMLACAVAGGGCLSVENRLVYHPRRDESQEVPPAPIQDLELTTSDGTRIHARWVPHPTSNNVILYCHGNGGNVHGWVHAIRDAAHQTDSAVLIFDYPGYGRSGGTPSEAGCYAAADASYRWLTEKQNVAPRNIILWGESLGGAVAIELATRKPHRALVLVRTFTSLPEVAEDQFPLLPAAMVMSNRFPSLDRIGQCRSPIFIACAENDNLMSPRHAERLRAACAAPTELCLLRGLGHNDPLPSGFYRELRAFLAAKAPAVTP